MTTKPQAEILASRALDWLCQDAARLGAFMGATGIGPATLRHSAGEPEVLLAVLDFLMADEAQLLACCTDLDLPPEAPAAARSALPGGEQWHWT